MMEKTWGEKKGEITMVLGPPMEREDWDDGLDQKATPEQIEEAQRCYGGDDIQIDHNARCSVVDNGFWVQAWVWLEADEQEVSNGECET